MKSSERILVYAISGCRGSAYVSGSRPTQRKAIMYFDEHVGIGAARTDSVELDTAGN
jgi:hypothetical protein